MKHLILSISKSLRYQKRCPNCRGSCVEKDICCVPDTLLRSLLYTKGNIISFVSDNSSSTAQSNAKAFKKELNQNQSDVTKTHIQLLHRDLAAKTELCEKMSLEIEDFKFQIEELNTDLEELQLQLKNKDDTLRLEIQTLRRKESDLNNVTKSLSDELSIQKAKCNKYESHILALQAEIKGIISQKNAAVKKLEAMNGITQINIRSGSGYDSEWNSIRNNINEACMEREDYERMLFQYHEKLLNSNETVRKALRNTEKLNKEKLSMRDELDAVKKLLGQEKILRERESDQRKNQETAYMKQIVMLQEEISRLGLKRKLDDQNKGIPNNERKSIDYTALPGFNSFKRSNPSAKIPICVPGANITATVLPFDGKRIRKPVPNLLNSWNK